MFRPMPVMTAIGAGALDGVVQNNDEAAGRVDLATQYGTWYEVGLFGGGIMLDMMRFGAPDILESLWLAGGTLLSKRLAERWLTLSITPTPYAVPSYAPTPMAAPARSYGFVNKQPSAALV